MSVSNRKSARKRKEKQIGNVNDLKDIMFSTLTGGSCLKLQLSTNICMYQMKQAEKLKHIMYLRIMFEVVFGGLNFVKVSKRHQG